MLIQERELNEKDLIAKNKDLQEQLNKNEYES